MSSGARNLIRGVVLLIVGAAMAGCDASTTTPHGASVSASPAVSASSSATSSPTASAPDPTQTWLTVHSAAGRLSFRYDPAWKPVECPPSDSPLIVLGANVCGQIEPSFEIDSVRSAQAPPAPDMRCDPSQPQAVSSSTTVDGVTGTREFIDFTTPAYDDCRHPIMHALAYAFYTTGRAYTIMYLYIPSEGADQTSNVDRMVQTLTLSAGSTTP